MKTLIKNGFLVNPKTNTNEIMDILIEDEIILKVSKNMDNEADEIIDASGLYVLPGLIDAHCHLREPGYEYKEDIESGTKSAIAGGFTAVACMPNTNPIVDNEGIVKQIIAKAKEKGHAKVYPIAAVTKGSNGKELTEIGTLKECGAVAFSDDGKPVASGAMMKKALIYASMFDATIISHCEELDLNEGGVINEGYVSTILGLKGIPAVSEELMVYRDVRLAEYTKTRVHIAHISTKESVNIIREAKKRGVNVTCETCPHYFSLTEEACIGFNPYTKVNPPLRTQSDLEAIIEGIADGTIDIIATDHAPHHEDEKNVEFQYAANGLVGFETALPLALTYLVKKDVITLGKLVELMSINPSKLLGVEGGNIENGLKADIIIVDLDHKEKVDIKKLKSKSKNSPFDGFELSGKVKYGFVNGIRRV